MKLLRTTGAALSLLVCDWGAFLGSAIAGVFGPPLRAFLCAARAVKEFLVPVFKVRNLVCPAAWGLFCCNTSQQALRSVPLQLKMLFQAVHALRLVLLQGTGVIVSVDRSQNDAEKLM